MLISLAEFPNTATDPFLKTSEFDVKYNCIAWAAEDSTRWYEPDSSGIYYWPKSVPREYSIDAYIKLYEHLGYTQCNDGNYESGFIKIAIFSSDYIEASHAARQLNPKEWTSKLGSSIDVSHSLSSIQNGAYGNVVQYLKKPQ